MNTVLKLLVISLGLTFAASASKADGLKVFGPEFCSAYDAGSCINFHYKDLKDAKTWLGKYKYPKGRAAYDKCAASSDYTDGGLAYCSMVFHYTEQSPKVRKQMCHYTVRNKYYELASSYAFRLYDQVWNCKSN